MPFPTITETSRFMHDESVRATQEEKQNNNKGAVVFAVPSKSNSKTYKFTQSSNGNTFEASKSGGSKTHRDKTLTLKQFSDMMREAKKSSEIQDFIKSNFTQG